MLSHGKIFPSRWRNKNTLSVVHGEPCSAMEGFFLPGGGLKIPCQLYIDNHAQPWGDFPSRWRTKISLSVVHGEPCFSFQGED